MGCFDDKQQKLVKGGGYDITSIEGRSAAAEGSDIQFGVAVVRGALDEDNNYGQTAALPDKEGDYLKDDDGVLYKDAGLELPVDADDNLLFLGVSHRSMAHPSCPVPLVQPIGPGDTCYNKKKDFVSIQTQGRIPVLVDEDVKPGDPVSFRTVVTDATDGLQFLGGFSKTDDGDHQLLQNAQWFQGGVAGGLAVLELNAYK